MAHATPSTKTTLHIPQSLIRSQGEEMLEAGVIESTSIRFLRWTVLNSKRIQNLYSHNRKNHRKQRRKNR
jgi:hypothetical protein